MTSLLGTAHVACRAPMVAGMLAVASVASVGCGGEGLATDRGSDGIADDGGGTTDRGDATNGGGITNGGAPSQSTTWGGNTDETGGGSSGGVEDTLFGMSDDMPLVADIPEIKRGLWFPGAWVRIEKVQPITGRASLGRDTWFHVQDPYVEEYMGLRVLLHAGELAPSADRWVDLEGWVVQDAQGWWLDLSVAVEGDAAPPVAAPRIPLSTLTEPDAEALDDSLIEVDPAGSLVVLRRFLGSDTLLVGRPGRINGAVLVDLRPFGLEDATLPPGTRLSRLQGIVDIGGQRPVILPRSTDDLVAGP